MTYLITVKPSTRGLTATVTRYTAVGLGRVVTSTTARTAKEAVAQARRDVRTARHCGGLK